MLNRINRKIKDSRNEEGFTLMELLVVILIIGILAAIAVPVFLGHQKASYKAAVQSDVRNTVDNMGVTLSAFPNASSFVPYAAGSTFPTLTTGQAAVQTVNSHGTVMTITNAPASGAAPSTGSGSGQWDSYQIVGSNAKVPNYCFVFTSTTGKYVNATDCPTTTADPTATASASPSATPSATPTPTPTATPVTPVYNQTFPNGNYPASLYPEWYIFDGSGYSYPSYSNNSAVGETTAQQNGNFVVMNKTQSIAFKARLITPMQLDPGTYKLTAIAKSDLAGTYSWKITNGSNVSTFLGNAGVWDDISQTFTVTTKSAQTIYIENTRVTSNATYFLDNISITKVS